MGTNIEITNVNKEANFVSYNLDGESKTGEVILPAQIKWAKVGKAEAGFTPDGKINFLKSLEPKTSTNNYSGGYQKPESKFKAESTMEILEDVTLKEVQAVYNELNAENNKKCAASTLFQRPDGKYDAALYVTTFIPKDQPAGPEM
jgi:hypothetical protein